MPKPGVEFHTVCGGAGRGGGMLCKRHGPARTLDLAHRANRQSSPSGLSESQAPSPPGDSVVKRLTRRLAKHAANPCRSAASSSGMRQTLPGALRCQSACGGPLQGRCLVGWHAADPRRVTALSNGMWQPLAGALPRQVACSRPLQGRCLVGWHEADPRRVTALSNGTRIARTRPEWYPRPARAAARESGSAAASAPQLLPPPYPWPPSVSAARPPWP
eukprot:365009-Chlamydomonas_euryale.AAC.11